MRAVVTDGYGEPAALAVRHVDAPKVGPDSVLVLWPLIPGWNVAGEVVGIGPVIRHVEIGQQVFGYARKDFVGAGTWAEQVAVPARGKVVIRVPEV